MPTFYFSEAEGALSPMTDSTLIILRLDEEHPERRVVPSNPALAFIDALIEDYADEWLTKAMFHYRWAFGADLKKSAAVLPNWFGGPLSDDELASKGAAFAERQVQRLSYVGSSPVTAPTIEESLIRFIDLLEEHLSRERYLLGRRPGACDFAIYGQMTQLALFDPTPMAIIAARAPRVVAWTIAMEDLSGAEVSPWGDVQPSHLLRSFLGEIGRTYAPLLIANAAALSANSDIVRTYIDGRVWKQRPFPYQGKCLAVLRRMYAQLCPDDLRIVDTLLADTGCEALFRPLSAS
jgi:glutathione S-transferase